MKLNEIIEKSSDFYTFAQEFEKQQLAKSILLISKDEIYSLEFAKTLAALILSGGKGSTDENYQKVFADAHPDLKIYPEKDKLLVADSENVVDESFVRPIFASKKVFIIKNIDISMEAAQNKLLKTLEEPPRDVYFILTAQNPNLVLPTIKSRCNKRELSKLSADSIRPFFTASENLEIVLALCDGYLGRAIKLSKLTRLDEIFEGTVGILTKLASSKGVLAKSKELSPFKDHFSLMIEILSYALEDILLIKSGKSSKIRLKSKKDELTKVSDDYSINAICHIEALLSKAVEEMTYNGNFTVVLENLLLNILEVKYICK